MALFTLSRVNVLDDQIKTTLGTSSQCCRGLNDIGLLYVLRKIAHSHAKHAGLIWHVIVWNSMHIWYLNALASHRGKKQASSAGKDQTVLDPDQGRIECRT